MPKARAVSASELSVRFARNGPIHMIIATVMRHFCAPVWAVVVSSMFSVACLFPSDSAHETLARRNVAERVRFDLGCDAASLERLGDVTRLGGQMTRMNIGATCAGKRAMYVVTCVSNWGNVTCSAELDAAHQASPASPASAGTH